MPSADRLSARAGRSIRNRVLWLLTGYIVVTVGVLTALLLYLHAGAVVSGEKLVSSFAQLAAAQTAGAIQNVEQTLQVADARLTAVASSGTASEDSVRAEFRDLLQSRPFVRAIWVLDKAGRSIYDSDEGNTGVDFSDRAYFLHHKEQSGSEFDIGAPIRSRTVEGWFIPATRARRGANGEFAGVIVAAVEPRFFGRAWSLDDAEQDTVIGLYRRDGLLLMRSPFVESAMGTSFANADAFRRVAAGDRAGVYRNLGVVDGVPRFLAFRQLALYPGLVVIVGKAAETVLAMWWNILWIVVIGWVATAGVLGGLLVWVVREWDARQATEARYRLLFETNPYPMGVIARDTLRYIAVNDAMVERYGWSREEFLTMSPADIRLSEDMPVLQSALQSVAQGAIPTIPGRHRKKDGTVIDVEVSLTEVEFGGRPAIVAMARDVTERNRAMNDFRESEEKYHELVDALPVGVLETTVNGRIVMANAAWRHIFGFGDDEDLGAVDISKLYADPPDRNAIVARATAEHTVSDTEAVFRRRDGTTFPAERHLRSMFNAEGEIVGLRGIVIDISSRKLLEAQLHQAQKMEAVGQLTGGVAHDFNNILMVILANAEALLEESGLDPEFAGRLRRIGQATQRAADLTRQLLAFSRKQRLLPRQTDLNDLARVTGELMRRTLGAQIELEVLLADDLWLTDVDRAQLEAALVNLCLNARDAMPAGGRLQIETKNATLDAARDSDVKAGDYVMLSVSDTGSGMPPEVLEHAIEPFFSTKEVGRGTGLGLSMVYGFIKQSMGHIKIRSEVGRGTTVELYLPRSLQEAKPGTVKPVKALPRGTERILVVEDDEQVRAVIVGQLADLGYAVTQAANGSEGLVALRAGPSYDLLLTDVVMPGTVNGRALAEEAIRLYPGTRVVFMSGYAEEMPASLGSLDPVIFLNKPFRKREVAQIIRETLDAASHRGKGGL